MQSSLAFASLFPSQANKKPCMTSFDSGLECSLDHLLEVCRLVEKEIEEDDMTGYVFDDRLLGSW